MNGRAFSPEKASTRPYTMSPLLILGIVLAATPVAPGARKPILPFESQPSEGRPAQNKIDRVVFDDLKRSGIAPSPLCSDAVFVRRVYLDAIGTLPTLKETKEFLADRRLNRRAMLIERLLERKEFADYWAVKWCDVLRVKSEFPINLWPNAVQGYHHWIRTCIRDNMPYDRFVREMLVSTGSNFEVPQVNFYRAVQNREPMGLAQAVGLSFMGVRPEGLTKRQWQQMAVFFSGVVYKTTDQWKEEIVLFDPAKITSLAASDGVIEAIFPDRSPAWLLPSRDPRDVFAQWLTSEKNPWFARAVVNRIWAWLLGRGIVHEPDDIRLGNPPSHPELLAYLESELIAAHFDLKHVYRLILNSNVYQLSSIPARDSPPGDAHFARYLPRRLDAEMLIDAICQVTGTFERYSSPIPEPFTFIPDGRRSIELADGSIGSAFLEMFGRPARDTGLESERNLKPSAAQQLHLLNSSHIRRKIEEGPKIRELLQSSRAPRDVVNDVYLTLLSRPATPEELEVLRDYAKSGRTGGRPMIDLVWALINSAEFLYRH
jgi:hypothetical protein